MENKLFFPKDLDTRIASGDGKFEHVINGTKHYLIIHSTQPEDSGIHFLKYDACLYVFNNKNINNINFLIELYVHDIVI